MTNHMTRAGLVLATALLAACGGERAPTTRPYTVLSDARSGGAPGFFFLPPVARQPAGDPANDPGLSPVVEIASLGATPALLVRFAGPEVKESGAHYMAQWSTKEHAPVAGTTYRITVLLDGTALGFADAQVAANGRELRLLASDEVFGLTGQRTVPIKFRIAKQKPDACEGVTCDPPAQCQAAVACDPAVASCVATSQPKGTACDDGNACTTGDACDGNGACAGTAVSCPRPTQCQASVACDPAVGACVAVDAPAGAACDDGNFCTAGDACDGEGACLAGTGSPCAAGDECNPLNRCSATSRACVYDHLVGTACTASKNGQPVAGTCAGDGASASTCAPL